MLGIDIRAARVTWTIFLIALLIWLVWLTRESILIFVAALFLAYMIVPLVHFVHHRLMPRVSRTLALAVVYLSLLATVGVLGVYLGSQAVEQAANLTEQLPDLARKHGNLETIPVPAWLEPYKMRVVEAIRTQLDASSERVLPLLKQAVGGVANVLGSVGFLILVPILSFLFLKDAEDLREQMLSWVPRRQRNTADDVLVQVHKLLGAYIRALAILSIATTVVYLIFFEVIRLPYAVLVSVLAAPLEFIPFIGPILGMLLVIVVAVFTGYPHLWWIILFFVVYRLFQDYFLQPYLLSEGVELHPLVVIFGALAGQQVGGLWGMFLSVPVLACLRIVLVQFRQRRSREALLGAESSTGVVTRPE